MFKISKQADYAFQLILELSALEKGELLSLKKFSNKSSISFLFLQKIAKSLREAGIIESVKGKNGGYKLFKPASSISLKEVVEAVEGPYNAIECNKIDSSCDKIKNCTIRHGVGRVNKQMIQYLEAVTVSSMIE